MMKTRHAILTVACFGLLSSGAMGMSPDEGAQSKGSTNKDNDTFLSEERTQPPSGFGSGNSEMGSQAQGHDMGMGSQAKGHKVGMGSDSQETESITGEILRVQDELYVVKDEKGKEVKLHVDHSTQTSGELKQGDKIEAEISTKRHAVSVKKTGGQDAKTQDPKPADD